jgi:rhodanese-related sulfurtransferase
MTTAREHGSVHVRELSSEQILDRARARRAELELPYAGAVTPPEAWHLAATGAARIVDVRTPPEFKFVGSVPGTPNVEWRGNDLLPTAMFIDGLRRVAGMSDTVLLLCRSGVRSHAAARAAATAGFRNVYNVLEGFEGQRNHDGHRSEIDGWRRHGLPWTQD